MKIDIKKLENEQIKLSKLVDKNDYTDFSQIQNACGIAEIINEKYKEILVGMVTIDINKNEIEKKWHKDKINFPYIPGFRAYREINALVKCYEKLEIKPDIFFIKANGICHPRKFGLACHFGLVTDSCVVGISDELLKLEKLEIVNDYIKIDNEIVGKFLKTVEFANPIIVSIGNKISIESALEITKRFCFNKYKYPYPLIAAKKFIRKIAKEL
ncbi:MAG: endonuclease V [Candidatus Pacearchaeota archaeon]